jgi:uncharacterized protein YkwD
MAVQSDKLDCSQPDNTLSKIAEEQRRKMFARNDFKEVNPYSSVNPAALADGDGKGRGQKDDNVAVGTSVDIANRNLLMGKKL